MRRDCPTMGSVFTPGMHPNMLVMNFSMPRFQKPTLSGNANWNPWKAHALPCRIDLLELSQSLLLMDTAARVNGHQWRSFN
jgi:hypothetical protein